jgi:hypothetical protein
MKAAKYLVLSWVCWALALGCGGSSDNDEGPNGGQDDEEDIDWSQARPPGNIDIMTCSSITEEQAPELDACPACCTAAGYSVSSFIYDGRCTCGREGDDNRETVCMTAAGLASSDGCQSCCSATDFSGYSWLGGSPGSCTCRGATENAACADSIAGPAGADACSFCCLEHGFLGSGYSNFGTEECSCWGP